MPECLESKQRLHDLSPERSLIASEPFKHSIVEVGETQEAISQIPRCAAWIIAESLEGVTLIVGGVTLLNMT